MSEETDIEKQQRLRIEFLEREIAFQRRLLDVLVAVCKISEGTIKQARDIVASFN